MIMLNWKVLVISIFISNVVMVLIYKYWFVCFVVYLNIK